MKLTPTMERDLETVGAPESTKRLNASAVRGLLRRGLVELFVNEHGQNTLRLTHAGFCYIPENEQ